MTIDDAEVGLLATTQHPHELKSSWVGWDIKVHIWPLKDVLGLSVRSALSVYKHRLFKIWLKQSWNHLCIYRTYLLPISQYPKFLPLMSSKFRTLPSASWFIGSLSWEVTVVQIFSISLKSYLVLPSYFGTLLTSWHVTLACLTYNNPRMIIWMILRINMVIILTKVWHPNIKTRQVLTLDKSCMKKRIRETTSDYLSRAEAVKFPQRNKGTKIVCSWLASVREGSF